jgi:hypothetical protein
MAQCFEQISVDVDLGKEAREAHRFDNLSGYEIVVVGGKIGTNRQSFLRSAKS